MTNPHPEPTVKGTADAPVETTAQQPGPRLPQNAAERTAAWVAGAGHGQHYPAIAGWSGRTYYSAPQQDLSIHQQS